MSDPMRALAEALRPYLQQASRGVTVFSQKDGERPPGCGRPKYLRAWRQAHEQGDAGAWSEGRARLMSAECWARRARTEAPSTAKAVVVSTPEDDLLAELGATRAA